ncbi:MAG: hypothetical protein C6W58_17575, partial [Bacillaceae bacterium]
VLVGLEQLRRTEQLRENSPWHSVSHDEHRNVVPHLREEAVNPVGDLLEGGVTTGIKRTAIHGSYENLRQLS